MKHLRPDSRPAIKAGLLALSLAAAVGLACDRTSAPTPQAAAETKPPAAAASETDAVAATEPTAEALEPEPVPKPLRGTPTRLLKPTTLRTKAPPRFRVKFVTTKGPFVVEVTRAWAPRGADRFYNLVAAGFYPGVRIHRIVDDTLVQFGIHGDPAVNHAWFTATLPDEPAKQRNQRGFVSLVGAGENSRRTELLVNLRDNPELDRQKVVPIGRVVSGLENLQKIPGPQKLGKPGPIKRYVLTGGEAYLASHYPKTPKITMVSLKR